VAVGEADHFLFGVEARERRDRSERLFTPEAHIRRDTVEHRRREEVAASKLARGDPRAAGGDARTA
jgi:hypothetical protein